MKLAVAAFVVLAEPLPPVLYVPVSLIILQVNPVAELLSVPDRHVVVDLHAFAVEKRQAEPVRQPRAAKELMVEMLTIFALRLNVLKEDQLKEGRLQENVDQGWPHLHNSDVKEESGPEDGKMRVIVNSSKAVELLVRQLLDAVVIDALLELPH